MVNVHTVEIIVTFSSDYSSSSSEEDSEIPRPEMKTSSAEARAKMERSLKDTKEIINGMSLDRLKVVRYGFLKRKTEDEILYDYRQKRHRLQQKRLAAEEKLRSRADGIASDSDAEEVESIWEPKKRKIRTYPPAREIERLVEADLQSEREEEEYWDAMYGDPEESEVSSEDSDSNSEEEFEEDSTNDDDDDNES
ncbi:glutamic acid-rich protein-like [Papaver somniferum]|uniref:glutamic acid-rich protein-like n=1 Tax=Papaver somniferum TaxID=3469 RepID=UPI000E6F795B|nr:glutamic acid-rich protein-like [Papaver somniferum]